MEAFVVVVDTLIEFAAEQLDAQNGEEQPEDETHQQHVEDGRNGEHQSVDHNLQDTSKKKMKQVEDRAIISNGTGFFFFCFGKNWNGQTHLVNWIQ